MADTNYQTRFFGRGPDGTHVVHTIRFADGFTYRVSADIQDPAEIKEWISQANTDATKAHEVHLSLGRA